MSHEIENADQPVPRLVDAVAEAIAAGVGVAVGGPAGAVLGALAAPYVLDASRRSWAELTDRRQRSVVTMVAEAANLLDEDPDAMLSSALATSAGSELVADAMQAAAWTLNEQKVHALARALANGLADDQAEVDPARLVVVALADIEEPHLAMLARMSDPQHRGWPFHPWHGELAFPFARSGELAGAIRHTLLRNGLIEENAGEREEKQAEAAKEHARQLVSRPSAPTYVHSRFRPAVTWRVTWFGDLVLQHLDGKTARETQ